MSLLAKVIRTSVIRGGFKI